MEILRRWSEAAPEFEPLAHGSFFRRLADLELALYERAHNFPYSGPSVKEARSLAEARARNGYGVQLAGGPKLQFLAMVLFTNSHCYLKGSVPSPQSPDLVTGWRLAMIERAEWDSISDVDARRERGQKLAVRELTDGLLWPMYEEALATSDLV